MKKFRILFLISTLGRGGAEMMLLRLLKHLDLDKYEPIVITLLDSKGPISSGISALGITVYSVSTKSKLDLISFVKLFIIMKNIKPVIVHTQLFAADILGRIFSRILNVPIVITSIRNMYYGGWCRKKIIKWTNCFSDRITIVSEVAACLLVKEKLLPAARLSVIYNGLDPDNYSVKMPDSEKNKLKQDLNIGDEYFTYLAVGSLTPQKGYTLLLSAMKQVILINRRVQLLVVGDGTLAMELSELAVKLEIDDRVLFLGARDDVPKIMALSDSLVLSSLWEGLPGVILEAMASKLPVVATNVGGTSEIVVDQETGFLVDVLKPDELAKKMLEMINIKKEKRIFMGKAGRKRVVEHFHVLNMVKAYEELYWDCLREKNIV